MKIQVLHTVWCYISGEAAGEIRHWSLLGVKGLIDPRLADNLLRRQISISAAAELVMQLALFEPFIPYNIVQQSDDFLSLGLAESGSLCKANRPGVVIVGEAGAGLQVAGVVAHEIGHA